MTTVVYVGTLMTAANSYQTSFKLRASDGGVSWSKAHGANVRAVAATPTDVFFGGFAAAGSNTHRRYTSDGTLIWSGARGAGIYGMIYDPDPNGPYVWTVGETVNSAQVERWAVSNGAGGAYYDNFYFLRAVGLGFYSVSGAVYFVVAGVNSSPTADNVQGGPIAYATWTQNLHTVSIEALAVDSSGAIHIVGGVDVGSVTTRKFDSARTPLWTANHGAPVHCVAVDSSGNVYTGGDSDGSSTTRKYNASGSLQWSAHHGAAVRGIAVDSNGNVYTTGDSNGSFTTRKYDASGGLIWSVDLGANGYAIAVVEELDTRPLAGSPQAVAVATARLHNQPAAKNQTLLASVMRQDNPSLLVPVTEALTPQIDQYYANTDQELVDISGYNREVLVNGTLAFITAGGNLSSRSPVPRVAAWGAPTVFWSGKIEPSIKTDLGPSDFIVTNAWTVECWYRCYQSVAGYYHWYFGNSAFYSPVLHHVYLAHGWFEIAGDRRKRVRYALSEADGASYHAVLVYDGANTVSLYINAALVATLSQSLAALNIQIDARARLYWGHDGHSASTTYLPYHAANAYSHLAFYPSALSAARVSAHYQAGISAAAPMTFPSAGVSSSFMLARKELR
ncbi:MAG: SBBP repeat-containing protein [Candidatus Competibacter denitrificans]